MTTLTTLSVFCVHSSTRSVLQDYYLYCSSGDVVVDSTVGLVLESASRQDLPLGTDTDTVAASDDYVCVALLCFLPDHLILSSYSVVVFVFVFVFVTGLFRCQH